MGVIEKEIHLAWDCLDKHEASWVNKHKTALITISESLSAKRFSFSQIAGLTNRFAHSLKQQSLTQGQRILLRLPNRIEFIISFFGALKAGVVPVPTSPLFTWEELHFLIEDSQASALITTPELCPEEIWKPGPNSLKKIILSCSPDYPLPKTALRWEDLLKAGDSNPLPYMAAPDDTAYWLYTSGTTGKPKGAVHAHRSIRAHDQRAKIWQGVSSESITFNTSALNWSYALTAGFMDLWRHGLPTLLYDGIPKVDILTEIIQRFGATTLMSVPGIYRRLCQAWRESPPQLANLKTCLSAGENLAETTREEFLNLTGLPIHQGLGMTENSIYLVQPSDEPPMKGSVGKSVFGDQIQILREDLTPAAPGETGILATSAKCPGLMLGYHRPDGSLELPWKDQWYLSGDLAYQDEAGHFFYVGRSDDLITAGGYRISPLEVEQVLNRHPAVLESIVVGQKEKDHTFLTAFVILRPETATEILSDQLKDFAQRFLAAYKVPRRFEFKNSLPKTVTGKLKRSDLSSV